MDAKVFVSPVMGEGGQEHQVRLEIGVQSFTVCKPRETRAEADWLAGQVRAAIATLTASFTSPTLEAFVPTPEHQHLMRFYGVKTLADLVTAQAKSIERLQSMRIKPDERAYRSVREG